MSKNITESKVCWSNYPAVADGFAESFWHQNCDILKNVAKIFFTSWCRRDKLYISEPTSYYCFVYPL